MRIDILEKIYSNNDYLTYLRYHPKWYIILNSNPDLYKDFENEIKDALKIKPADKIANLSKQISFVNGLIKYFKS